MRGEISRPTRFPPRRAAHDDATVPPVRPASVRRLRRAISRHARAGAPQTPPKKKTTPPRLRGPSRLRFERPSLICASTKLSHLSPRHLPIEHPLPARVHFMRGKFSQVHELHGAPGVKTKSREIRSVAGGLACDLISDPRGSKIIVSHLEALDLPTSEPNAVAAFLKAPGPTIGPQSEDFWAQFGKGVSKHQQR